MAQIDTLPDGEFLDALEAAVKAGETTHPREVWNRLLEMNHASLRLGPEFATATEETLLNFCAKARSFLAVAAAEPAAAPEAA